MIEHDIFLAEISRRMQPVSGDFSRFAHDSFEEKRNLQFLQTSRIFR